MRYKTKLSCALLVSIALSSMLAFCSTRAGDLPGRNIFGKAEATYLFFADGVSRCRLVLPAEPEKDEQEAAELIREMFRIIGAVETDIVNEPAPEFDGLDIHLGATTFAKSLNLLPADMDADGFVIYPADANRLVLLGGRAISAFYAATEFLERYADVMWIWPGEQGKNQAGHHKLASMRERMEASVRDYGTVAPQRSRFEARVCEQICEPAFTQRKLSGSGAKMNQAMPLFRIYRDSNYAHDDRSRHHHNVWRVLTKDMFETNPEYFSMVGGKRKGPVEGSERYIRWQACISNPKVIELFIAAAREQFEKEPWVRSFSVTPNDEGGFCECENCRALDGSDGWSQFGRYYSFVNAVADGIRDEYPDKLIALGGTVDVPEHAELRSNTMIYASASAFDDHYRPIKDLSRVAPHLGVYFWMHGMPMPRFYAHRWAEYLRFLRQHNVREVYAELYPETLKVNGDYQSSRTASWELDGPRTWIISKLLWDPEADVNELMERFCRGFYGSAAEPMLCYYRQLEIAWERRKDPLDFGREVVRTDILPLALEFYSVEDLDIMEECLDKAFALAADDAAARSRLAALQTRLTPVAAFTRQLALANALAIREISDRAMADKILAQVSATEKRKLAARETTPDDHPFLNMADRNLPVLLSRTEMPVDECFSRITKLLGGEAADFWKGKMTLYPELERFITPQMSVLENIAPHPSFEAPDNEAPGDTQQDQISDDWHRLALPGWAYWVRPHKSGKVGVATNVGRTGDRSLVITGADNACGIHSIAVAPGERYRVSVWAKTNARSMRKDARSGGRMTVRFISEKGEWRNVEECLNADAAEWTQLGALITVPPDVKRMVILLGAENQAPEEQTWFDDVRIEKITEASAQ